MLNALEKQQIDLDDSISQENKMSESLRYKPAVLRPRRKSQVEWDIEHNDRTSLRPHPTQDVFRTCHFFIAPNLRRWSREVPARDRQVTIRW